MVNIVIKQGDNLETLKQYPDNYFDSVVTDCPYGLGKEPDANRVLFDWVSEGFHKVKGKGFMCNDWDAFVPQPLFWKEIFRVLKPGGYVLAFFGTRTYDWGTMAIRLAGFEIRDMITWHYGSGFPKSLNISKAIDAAAGAEREIIGTKGLNSFSGTRADKNKGRFGNDNRTFEQANALTSPTTDKAIEFDGYGTALKPATEPICVARKPLDGTVVENILKWGTGGINLDGCRIDFSDTEPDSRVGTDKSSGNVKANKFFAMANENNSAMYKQGRFPANVIFDPFTASILDDQTGELTSGKPSGVRNAKNNIYGQYAGGQPVTGFGDTGGASRFFYVAKASQDERNAGCEHLTDTVDFGHSRFDKCSNCGGYMIQGDNRATKCVCDNPERENLQLSGNHHPTVKPIALIRYLQRLVTPKGGKCLDPYSGSGTSGCAACFEEIGEIVLLELIEKYIPIIEARTAHWQKVANREIYIEQLKKSQTKLF